MSWRKDIRVGGICTAGVDGIDMHISSSRDIHASRFVSVHICDVCGCLFVPMDAQKLEQVAEKTRGILLNAFDEWRREQVQS